MSDNYLPPDWENTPIGKFEKLYSKRLNFSGTPARIVGAFPIAVSCEKVKKFRTQLGIVTPHIFIILIALSGTGKSPIIVACKAIIRNWKKDAMSIPKFTTQGMSDYIHGRPPRKDKDGNEIAKEILPHETITIIRDECSRVFKDAAGNFRTDMLEFLSEAHDNEYEGDVTRSQGVNEGGWVYLNFLGASTEYLFEVLPKKFFTQGLGNKFTMLTWKLEHVDKHDTKFFIDTDQKDEELEKLKSDYKKVMDQAMNFKDCYITGGAAQMWCDFEHEYRNKAIKIGGTEGSFLSKLPLAVLRLAILYAANMDRQYEGKDVGIIKVCPDDMKLAIWDGLQLKEERSKVMLWNREVSMGAIDDTVKNSRYSLESFVLYTIKKGGVVSTTEIKAHFNLSNSTKAIEVMELGVSKGWMKLISCAGMLTQDFKEGKVPKEIYETYKTTCSPTIYQVTDEGRAAVGC